MKLWEVCDNLLTLVDSRNTLPSRVSLASAAMAETQHQQATPMKAPFPAPPPFYKHFTSDNLAQLRRLRKEAGVPTNRKVESSDDAQAEVDILSLPTELRYLIPPPPPSSTQPFHAFGFERSLAAPPPTLAEADIPQLYPDHPAVRLNPQAHLISLARSLLTTFLALVGNLAQNPGDGWEEETTDLKELAFNLLDLINQYRPHQARETLIMAMEDKLAKERREIEQVAELRKRVDEAMGGLEEGAGAVRAGTDVGLGGGEQGEGADGKRKARQRAAWAALAQTTGDGG